jgi:hypothetical protein
MMTVLLLVLFTAAVVALLAATPALERWAAPASMPAEPAPVAPVAAALTVPPAEATHPA